MKAVKDLKVPHAHALECECGSRRKVAFEKSSKTWVFWCRDCKKWFWLPRSSVNKETVKEWIRLKVEASMKDTEGELLGLLSS